MPRSVRVASVPQDHVYVRHLDPVAPSWASAHAVVRLPDPPTGPDGQWWPPQMLRSGWVRDHADDFDLMHIHFGFDAVSPHELTELVTTLREAGKPLVLTVHDLRNPHHDEPGLHLQQLGVLVAGADELITLTPGAAAEIRNRWGRDAAVLGHPHVFDLATIAKARPEHPDFRIGVHCKSLRACMAPAPVVDAIVDLLPELPGAVLQVDAHTDVIHPERAEVDNPRYDPALAALLRRLGDDGAIDLRVHDYYSDDELRDYLFGLDVSVLPYRFGTHSGWAEACFDLGTGVVAPTCGYYHDQVPTFDYDWHDDDTLHVTSLHRALRQTYDRRGQYSRATADGRRRQRDDLAYAHHDLYRQLLREPACASS